MANKTDGAINSANDQDEKEAPKYLCAGVTQEQLDDWKIKYGEVHIITVMVNENESVTGYFKKPNRDIMANCVNLVHDKKTFEAREFLLNNTFIGGDKAITTVFDNAIAAQTKLWTQVNFRIAEGLKY